jgi:hypothetical protein
VAEKVPSQRRNGDESDGRQRNFRFGPPPAGSGGLWVGGKVDIVNEGATAGAVSVSGIDRALFGTTVPLDSKSASPTSEACRVTGPFN